VALVVGFIAGNAVAPREGMAYVSNGRVGLPALSGPFAPATAAAAAAFAAVLTAWIATVATLARRRPSEGDTPEE
jgi:hypothetical protein